MVLSLFQGNKKSISIVLHDYVVRMVEMQGTDFSSVKRISEKYIPAGIIQDGKMVDEIGFFEFMQHLVTEWNIKGKTVKFYVPDSTVILKKVDIPPNVPEDEILGHFLMEIGQSLHFPFQNPVFDIHLYDGEENKRKGLLFAAPEDELVKFAEIFEGVGLQPIAADVSPLGVYRFYHQLYPAMVEKSVMFLEFNLTKMNIAIFSNHLPEFIRHQSLNVSEKDWSFALDNVDEMKWTFVGNEEQLWTDIQDLVADIERIMNFYRYSMHKGEKSISQLVVLGDHPYLDEIALRFSNNLDIPLKVLDAKIPIEWSHRIDRKYIPVFGLSLKEVE
ncbi:type IV pilus biogenesis protein PilM [Alkalihalobacterium bogoriense]|uniref:type IV pilus biogenesis protein PilM n=1 Tax=Alkalihalobacterium bogoriense TaxID=246272 RepID=UPI000479C967|nr:pilus assembly protein PilM [Alkalihalobacterium bogoriense]